MAKNRVRTGMSNNELTCAIPASRVDLLIERPPLPSIRSLKHYLMQNAAATWIAEYA
jgi:hypothetical protein